MKNEPNVAADCLDGRKHTEQKYDWVPAMVAEVMTVLETIPEVTGARLAVVIEVQSADVSGEVQINLGLLPELEGSVERLLRKTIASCLQAKGPFDFDTVEELEALAARHEDDGSRH